MLGNKEGKRILDGFCRTTETTNDPYIDFEVKRAYLGLLTVLPKDDESAYTDGDGNTYYFKEPSDPEYRRICLNDKNPLEEKEYLKPIDVESIEVDDTTVLSAYIENDAYIMFPETSDVWGEIAGFGLFREDKGTTMPYLWGSITALDGSTVNVKAEEIPIIRAKNFKISLR